MVITKEDFPRVLLVRGKELDSKILLPFTLAARSAHFSRFCAQNVFGPFPHGLQLKEAMRIIRKIFPYRDTCMPCEEMNKAGKPCKACFNRHIGLVPGRVHG